MENLHVLMQGLPPVSRYWAGGLMLAHAMVQFKLVPGARLEFSVSRAFSTQPWRVITSFFYYGPLSMNTLFSIYNTVQWSKLLEESFSLSRATFPDSIAVFDEEQQQVLMRATRRLEPLDYFHYLVLMAVAVIGLSTYGSYVLGYPTPMMGGMLYEILTYILCRRNPQLQVGIFGIIVIRGIYIPLMSMVFALVSSEEFSILLQQLSAESFTMGSLWNVLTTFAIWRGLVCISIGHFLWFVHSVLFDTIYDDRNNKRYSLRHGTVKRVQQAQQINYIDMTKTVMRWIMLPPWYWVMIHNIKRRRY
ncbi:hypothetical protein CANTEDRAFT_102578 [Yamadazyma tenuis ATCC 10573]|uniref:Derlin n=1 Tax=Candida tenuis (strain ATCC 10573 / BCRC 21748 / CBS 615 / JCM 9827 / NBRC 10315 / NRRL Y-1498 / VKM Y-70) TaxID=590646 RepID=G3B0P3_CANTC|nr:uncharacterized protein CANTEDRAFT_102578 [Yamadazyma tenuis ATCC 10573]EGV65440.1 hypothetical protein CANTEDRAFT_102578 [Yamadazyma tenuis ATCC 10573]